MRTSTDAIYDQLRRQVDYEQRRNRYLTDALSKIATALVKYDARLKRLNASAVKARAALPVDHQEEPTS